jgi:hypothetical protein
MKTAFKQLHRDLRAAVLLGRPEAVDIALDGLLELPGVPSNDQMSEGFIERIVIPVGETLAGLKSSQLRPLLEHPLAVGRGVGGVALAYRYVKEGDSTPEDLRLPGNDHRLDVRLALGKSLFTLTETDPEATFKLETSWINQSSSRLRYTALIFLPALASKFDAEIFSMLAAMSKDPNKEVQFGLVGALNQLAVTGYPGQVLNLLSLWSSESKPNSWVICRALSASWATNHATAVKLILQEVKAKTGEFSQVAGALKALKRHGLEIDIS